MLNSIQVITSALNEEECLLEYYSRTTAVFENNSKYNWSLLICDNGSSDSTWQVIQDICRKDNRVRGIRMSRTFSLDSAFTMGLDESESDAVVLMASDLQDEPEIIEKFLVKWEEGFDQVVAKVIKKSHVPFVRKVLSLWFYKIANKLTAEMIPRNVSDFRLMSRDMYIAVRGLREKNRFLRGLIAWTGFRTAIIEIDRPARFAGNSKYEEVNLKKVIYWATSAILSHTTVPLNIISAAGLVLSCFSFIGVFLSSVFWVIYGVPFAGFGTIVGILFLGFSVLLLAIGVIAQYLGLIYEEVKNRPIYIKAEDTREF